MRVIQGFTPTRFDLDRLETERLVELLDKYQDQDLMLIKVLQNSGIVDKLSRDGRLVLVDTGSKGLVSMSPALSLQVADLETWTALVADLKALIGLAEDKPTTRRIQAHQSSLSGPAVKALTMVKEMYQHLMKSNPNSNDTGPLGPVMRD